MYIENTTSFKNKLINGDFKFWQRGTTVSGTTGNSYYMADRWRMDLAGTSAVAVYSQQSFTVGQTSVPNEPQFFSQVAISNGGDATNGAVSLLQAIESVRTFANKKVTLSFWAQATSGTPKLGVEYSQNFGSGGSPSSAVSTPVGSATLSTTWQKFNFTTTLPSISGKTIGTTINTDSLNLVLWMSAGTALATRSSTTGIQTSTFQISSIQLEVGDTATDFESRPYQVELALCQRYCYLLAPQGGGSMNPPIGYGFVCNTVTANTSISLPSTMRILPTLIGPATPSNYQVSDGLTVTALSTPFISINNALSSTKNVTFLITTGATLTQYRPIRLETNTATPSLMYLSAEF